MSGVAIDLRQVQMAMAMQCSSLSLLGDLKKHLLRANLVWGRKAVVVPLTNHHMPRTRKLDEGEDESRRDGGGRPGMARAGVMV